MQNLKVTLAQVEQFWEDKQKNLDHFTKVLSGIGETDLILLPEMFHTGFSMNAEGLAEETGNSPALDWLKATAAEKGSAIYTSFIAKEDGKFFNRGVFAEPNGKLSFYDKRRTFGMAGESEIYTQGEKSVVVDYAGWKINLQICYDLRFPEISRNRLDEHDNAVYDLCLYVANWPERRIAHWNTLLPARALENQSFVAAVNRIGTDAGNLEYNGCSGIWSATGENILKTGNYKEQALSLELSKADLESVRKNLPFLKDNL